MHLLIQQHFLNVGNTMMIAFNIAIVCGAFTSYGLDVLIGPHPSFRFCHPFNQTMTNVTDASYDI